MSFSAVKSAKSAAHYYSDKDNYYLLGNLDSRWEGKGAEELGLQGSVDSKVLTEILLGRLPDGSSLSRKVEGKEIHRAGYDLTFSAPKSVSIMALVGGDRRLIEAHNKAVSVALKEVQDLASARITRDGVTKIELTGNVIGAIFNHDTSRDLDPQLHSHVLIANATKTHNGWRALASDTKNRGGFSEAVLANQIVLGNIYRQTLRRSVQAMGYETQESGKNGLWELVGVPTEPFSQRSQVINDAVAKDASLKSRDIAALDTRKSKKVVDPAQLLAEWQSRLITHKFDANTYRKSADDKQLRDEMETQLFADALKPSWLQQPVSERSPGSAVSPSMDHPLTIGDAVSRAISILSDDKVRFTFSDLLAKTAAQLDAKPGIFRRIRIGIDVAIEQNRLIPLDKEKGIFTSDIHLLNELTIGHLAQDLAGKHRVVNFTSETRSSPDKWSPPVSALRKDRPSLAILEGNGAGATAIRVQVSELASMANDMGRQFWVLAADHKSEQWLKQDRELSDRIVSRNEWRTGFAPPVQSTIIIEQAEKLNLKDTLMLLDEARKQSAQLIFFDTGKRQGTGNALDALKASKVTSYRWEGNRKVDVRLITEPDKRVRFSKLAEDYVKRSEAGERVVAQVNGVRERQHLNNEIRSALHQRGLLGNEVIINGLSPVWLTNKTRLLRENYKEGMVLEHWNSDQKRTDRWTIHRVGAETNSLTLIGEKGHREGIKISQLDASWSLFQVEKLAVAVGDRLNVTSREANGELKAGFEVKVSSLNEKEITLRLGRTTTKLKTNQALKLKHGYVESLGSSLGDQAHILAALTRSDMNDAILNQLARSGEHITLYTAMDKERAETRLANSPVWRMASSQVKDSAGKDELSQAIQKQQTSLYTPAQKAVRLGAEIAQGKHRSGMVFSSAALLEASAFIAPEQDVSLLQKEIKRQVAVGDLIKLPVVKGVGSNLLVPRASYELERSIIRHIVEGKEAVKPLMAQIPESALDSLTPGQRKSTELVLQSRDRFIAIQGSAGVGKTTQLKALLGAIETLPRQDRPEITGLAPTHRAVLEMQAVGVKAQTLASFLSEERQKHHDGQINRYSGRVFLIDESSMIGNRDMAEAFQMIAAGGGRAVSLGDKDQLTSPESGVPFSMQQQRSPIDIAVMKDIVRQTPKLRGVVYSMIAGQYWAALQQAESVGPSTVPRKEGAWQPESSVVEIIKTTEEGPVKTDEKPPEHAPNDPLEAIALDYTGRTLRAQRDTLIVVQTNDDRRMVNRLIHNMRHRTGETGENEVTLQVLESVSTRKETLRATIGWQKQMSNYAFIDNEFWKIQEIHHKEGTVILQSGDQQRHLSVFENSTVDISLWKPKQLVLSEGDRLRFAATDIDRGYIANSLWDLDKIGTDGSLTLKSGNTSRVIHPVKDLHDQRIDLAYAVTTHGSQGASPRYTIAMQGTFGKRAMLATKQNAYVATSRPREHLQVYTDNKDKWVKLIDEQIQRMSAHDLLQAKDDRASDVGTDILGHALPAAETGLGRSLLKSLGITGDFKGKFVRSSAKYPAPHMAFPLWDDNGHSAGALLIQVKQEGNQLSLENESRIVGRKAGRFAGIQKSNDGKVIVVTTYQEAFAQAVANSNSGILIRLSGEGAPWQLDKLLNGEVDLRKDIIVTEDSKSSDPIPLLSPEEQARIRQEKKAIEKAASENRAKESRVQFETVLSMDKRNKIQDNHKSMKIGLRPYQNEIVKVVHEDRSLNRNQQLDLELRKDRTLDD